MKNFSKIIYCHENKFAKDCNSTHAEHVPLFSFPTKMSLIVDSLLDIRKTFKSTEFSSGNDKIICKILGCDNGLVNFLQRRQISSDRKLIANLKNMPFYSTK